MASSDRNKKRPSDARPVEAPFRPKYEQLEDRLQPAIGITGFSVQGSVPDAQPLFDEGTPENGALIVQFTVGANINVTVTGSFGDGNTQSTSFLAVTGTNNAVFSQIYTWADDNPTNTSTDLFTATASIVTAAAENVSATANGTVSNVAPGGITVTGGNVGVLEGQAVTLTGTFTDASSQDTFTVSVAWGDGSTSSVGLGAGANPHTYSISHLYADDNPTGTSSDLNNISVTIVDDDTGTVTASTQVTVSNVAPGGLSITGGGVGINEGQGVTLTGTFTDAGTLDTFTVSVAWGDGGTSSLSLPASAAAHSYTVSHLYVDDNPTGTSSDLYTASVTVSDDDALSASGSVLITVSNVAPTITGINVSPTAVNEGAALTLTVSFTDPGVQDTFTATVSWGDGTTGSVALGVGTTSFSTTHSYADDAPTGTSSDGVSISVNITDDDTGSVSGSIAATVNDVAPGGIGISPGGAFSEGTAKTVTVTFTDASSLDTFTATVSWGDATTDTVAIAAGTNLSFTASHIYADDTPTGTSSDAFTISVSIVDDDTLAGSVSTSVTVNDVAPSGIAVTVSPTGIVEGSSVTATVTFTDVGVLDTFTATVSWGDGSTGSVALAAGTTSFTASHLYADDNPTGTSSDAVTVGVSIVDDDTLSGSGSAAVTISDAAPTGLTADAGGVGILEGQTVTLTGTFDDIGTLDTFTVSVAWGDGTTSSVGVGASAATHSYTVTHQYADDNPTNTSTDAVNISVTVVDDDTLSMTASTQVTVSNVAPSGVALTRSPGAVNEGSTLTLTVTFTDPGVADTFTATISWGDATTGSLALTAGTTSFSATHSYADDSPTGTSTDAITISVNLVDDDTGSASGSVAATVNNVAPGGIGINPGGAVNEGSASTITVTFTDASSLDTFTATVSWGDGTTSSVTAGAGATHSFTVSHIYLDDSPTGTSSDLDTISVSIVDDDTGTGSSTAGVTVNNVAPSGVAVTVNPASILEGSTQSITVTFTDPGILDTFTAVVTWGDGVTGSVALGAGVTSFSATHLYVDDNPTGTSSDAGTVVVTITDDDTGSGSGSVAVTMSDSAPVLTGLGTSAGGVLEGTPFTITLSFTDAGTLDTFTATVDWGDSTPTSSVAISAGANPRTFTASHIYLDDNPTGTPFDINTISVTVVDDDTLAFVGTANVTVSNVAPTVSGLISPLSINEGQSATLTLTINDPGVLDTYTATITWGDGNSNTVSFAHTPSTSASFTLSFSHLYLDDNPTSTPVDLNRIFVQITDDDLGTAGPFNVDTILINNIAPTITGVGTSANPTLENDTLTITVSFTDPGTLDTHTITVDWADASTITATLAAGVTSFTASHQYLDDNPSNTPNDVVNVVISLTDDDTGTTSYIQRVTINNVAPVITGVAVTTPLNEGDIATATVSFSDQGTLDTHSVTVSWGDGQTTTISAAAGVTSVTTTHIYVDDGAFPGNGTASDAYTVAVTITDDDTGTGSGTAGLTVSNVAPSITGLVSTNANEGSAATLTVTFTDPGVQDTFTATISWGDGTFGTRALSSGTTSFTASHVYVDDNPTGTSTDLYSVSVALTDDDLGTASGSVGLTVSNVAPVLQGINGSPNPVNEGSIATLTVSFTDVGLADDHTVTVSWGDGSTDTVAALAGVTSVTATHVYQDDAPTGTAQDLYSVSVGISDDDTGTASGTVGIVVSNVAPGITGTSLSATTINEADTVTLTVTFTDASSLDTFTATVNWGDGSTDTTSVAANVFSFTVSHLYVDDGVTPGNGTPSDLYTIGIQVTDDDTGFGTGSTLVTVNNVAPVIATAVTSAVNEGDAATLTVSITDPGVQDAFTVTVNWGDGLTGTRALAAGTVSFTASHVYVDDGAFPGNGTASDAYTVAVTITDDDTGTASGSAGLTVSNVAPSITGLASTNANEGSAATLTVTFTDPGVQDTFTATISWGDGTFGTRALSSGTTSFTASHVYVDDNPTGTSTDLYSVSVALTDDDTGTASGSVGLTVSNVAPVIQGINGSPNPVNEGSAATLTVSFTDVGLADDHTVTVSWGDGSTDTAVAGAGITSLTATHVYQDDAPTGTAQDLYSVSVGISDDDTGTASGTVGIVVSNVAPGITGTSLSATTINEADTVTLTVTFTDASSLDTFTATVNWGDGSTDTTSVAANVFSFTASHVYVDDGVTPGNGTPSDVYSIGIQVTDDDTGFGTGSTLVTVNNVAPVIATAVTSAVNEGDAATLTVSITDPGVQDAFTVTVNWGDGVTGTRALAAGTVSFTASHVYVDDGAFPGNGTASDAYTVAVTITDDDTGTASDTAGLTVSNVAPSITGLVSTNANEGSAATLTVTFTDPGVQDTFTATISWGDGTFGTRALSSGTTSFTASHVYVDDNPTGTSTDLYSVSVALTDDDTGTASGSVGLTVSNVAPVIQGINGSPNPVNEGSAATLTVSFTDVGLADDHTVTVSWGDGSTDTAVAGAGITSLTATHVYQDDAPTGTAQDLYSVSVGISDDDTGTASGTVGIVVSNVAPGITGTSLSATTINEADTVTLTVTFTDASSLDTFTATVNWGDGSTDTTSVAANVFSFTVSHLYVDDGVTPGNGTPSDLYTIGIQVTDDDTGFGTGSTLVTVNNVAPVIATAVTSAVNEGDAATLTVSITDPGVQDAFTVTVNWGDGVTGTRALAAGTVSFTASHVYVDDGAFPGNGTASDAYTVAVTITDDDTGTGSDTAGLTVSNVAPSIVSSTITPIVSEGSAATLTVSITDPGHQDAFTATISWGDGTTGTVDIAAGGLSFTASHVYVDDEPTGTSSDLYSVSVAITDDDTGTASGSVGLTVSNVAPVIQGINTSPNPVNEGSIATLTVSFTDVGVLDTHTVTVSWGDGSTDTAVAAAGITSLTATHVYQDDAPTGTAQDLYSVSVGISDDDTGTASGTVGIVVANVAPTGVAVSLSGPAVFEGGTVTATVTFTDASSLDTFTATVNWGDGTTGTASVAANVFSFTASHVYLDDGFTPGNGTSSDLVTIAVDLVDDDTGSGSAGADLTVNNFAPTNLTVTQSSATIPEAGTVSITVTFTDVGILDGHTVTVNWGDGISGTRALAANVTSFSATHSYVDDGLFPGNGTPSDAVTIAVSITDDDTGTASASSGLTVNNVAPTIGAAVTPAITEGAAATLTVSITDPGLQDAFTATISWGDGTSGTRTIAPGTTSFTASHVYVDDGVSPGNGTSSDAYSVSVAIIDDDTGTGSVSSGLTVSNVAPVITGLNAGPSSVAEGAAMTFTVSLTDVGVADAHTVTISWGDGLTNTATAAAGVTSLTAVHVYADDNPTGTPADPYVISVAVTDDDLGTTSRTFGIVVNNVLPIVALAVVNPVLTEGETVTANVAITDPGVLDTFTLSFNWGDGTASTFALAAGTKNFTATHQYLDDGFFPGNGTPSDNYFVVATVYDDDAGVGAQTQTITVNNAAPSIGGLTVSANLVAEGSPVTVSGTVSDIGTKDVLTVVVAWGDGTTSTVPVPLGGTTFTATHTYVVGTLFPQQSTLFSITATVTDDDTGSNVAGAAVSVFNPLPPLGLPTSFAVAPDAGGGAVLKVFNADSTEKGTISTGLGDFSTGTRVATADVNGDGVADYIVGTGPGVRSLVRVIDGRTGTEIFRIQPFEASFTGGVFVAAGDLNGDGLAEVIVTPDQGGGPRVRIFSGIGAPLADFFGIEDKDFRGGARAAVGDLNGDGIGDLVVSAGFEGGPRIAAYDGRSLFFGDNKRKFFADFFVFEAGVRNGAYVAVGDVNGDGFADLIAGGGPGGGPRVRIFSGRSLVEGGFQPEIANFFGGDPNNREGIRVAAKDLNNDSFADVVVGAGQNAGSRVTTYAGAQKPENSELRKISEFDAFPGFGGGVFVG